MSDYINRQDAIDAIEQAMINHDSAIMRVVDLPSAQQWIPCSERLPENGEEVLASTPDFIYITLHEFINNHHWWSEVVEYRLIHNVIAWMPLPEPYKERG